jgi:hypothetical protein
MEYVYILQEREFIRLNENTYKIGRTSGGPHARFKGYPKDSKLLFLQNVTDSKTIEKQIKKVFKYKYIQMTEYGLEYFRGDINDMIDDIRTIIKHERNEYSINTSDVIRFMTEFTCQCVDKNIAISTTVMYKHYRSWVEKTHRSAVDISIFADTIESILPRVSDNLWNLNINMLKVRLIEVIIVPATILVYEELKKIANEAKNSVKKLVANKRRKPLPVWTAFVPLVGIILAFSISTGALFSDKEQSSTNILKAADVFPTPTPSATPAITPAQEAGSSGQLNL